MRRSVSAGTEYQDILTKRPFVLYINALSHTCMHANLCNKLACVRKIAKYSNCESNLLGVESTPIVSSWAFHSSLFFCPHGFNFLLSSLPALLAPFLVGQHFFCLMFSKQ